MNSLRDNKEHAFDAYVKKILRNEARDIYRARSRQHNHEIMFSELPFTSIEKLNILEDRLNISQFFKVQKMNIPVHDEDLSEALRELEDRYRDIILFSYFAGFTDKEISEILNLPRSTIQWQRKRALSILKKSIGKKEGLL